VLALGRLAQEAALAVAERVHGDEDAAALLSCVLEQRAFGRAALVSSFGADSAVLLHMVSRIDPLTPVLFVDTGKHFAETLAYRDRLVTRLGLGAVVTVTPTAAALRTGDPEGTRHRDDPEACCALRKVRPLEAALTPFDAWITGRRRDQAWSRTGMPRFELDAAGRWKVNPLADWSSSEVTAYLDRHRLPAHPLVARGYPSIGCATCTSRVAPGEDARAGRWRGRAKTECGLHVVDGRLVRTSQGEPSVAAT
jgi:phosphoadenosine phosphosulfate reductase